MRRLCSILLLAFFGLSMLSPLLALPSRSTNSLPACCQKHGTHHCLRTTGATAQAQDSGATVRIVRTVPERCPYAPRVLPATHTLLAAPATQAAGTHTMHEAGRAAQSEAGWRSARAGARHKRGPPAELL